MISLHNFSTIEDNHHMTLRSKIRNKQALVGIIGLGYVGLPLVLRFCEVGFRVLGFDTDNKKVESLNRGESYIKHIPSTDISALLNGQNQGRFAATSDMSRLGEPDVLIICVPTPLDQQAGAGLAVCGKHRSAHRRQPAPGPADFLGKHHLSRHHRRIVAAHPGCHSAGRGRIFTSFFLLNGKIRATLIFRCAPFPRWWGALPRPA